MDTQQFNTLMGAQRPKDLFFNGYQQLTVTGVAAQQLTVPAGTVYAEVKVESATTTGIIIRYTNGGAATPPTTTTGMTLAHNDYFDMNNGDLVVALRVIAVSGSHLLNVQYYKY